MSVKVPDKPKGGGNFHSRNLSAGKSNQSTLSGQKMNKMSYVRK